MDATKTHLVHDLDHKSPLISCRYLPGSSSTVFIGAQDYSVWRYDLETKAKVEYVFPEKTWVRGMAFDSTGKMLITAGFDGRLIWWPTEGDSPKPICVIDAHHGWVRAVAISPDDSLVASVGNDMVVRLWNFTDGTLVREMKGHESHIYNVAFHPDGTHLATGDLTCQLIDWEVASGKQVRSWKAESLQKYDKTFKAIIGGFRSMTFSHDGNKIAVSGITNVSNAFAGVGNPSVVVFDWEAGKQQIEHLTAKKVQGVAWGVKIHPSGLRIAAIGGRGGYLMFWKPDGAEEFSSLKLARDGRDLDLAKDGLHLAVAHSDGHLRTYKMDAKAES